MFERLTGRTGNGQIYLVEGLEEGKRGLNDMTKSELKAGYIVQLADGNCATVVGDVLDGKTTRILLSSYNNDLTHKYNQYLDITKVGTFCSSTTDEYYFEKGEVIILWERPKNESEVNE